MSKSSLTRLLTLGLKGGIPFLIALVVWEFLTRAEIIKPFFLPPPWVVANSLWQSFWERGFWTDIGASTYRVVIGYGLAVLIGVPVGIGVGASRRARAITEPFTNFIRYTPLSAFVPLVILWVGLGDWNAITLVFLGVVWTLIVLAADAISSVPKHYLEVARTLGLSTRQVIWRVSFRHALPALYDALRLGLGLAWSSVVLAEVAGANTGIGHMLMNAQRFLKTPAIFGGVILVGTLGLLSDSLFLWFYPRLFPWSERARRSISHD